MGCSVNNHFNFDKANTINELIEMIKFENLKIKDELDQYKESDIKEIKNQQKVKFYEDFLELSDMMIKFIEKKNINKLNILGKLLEDCYSNLLSEFSSRYKLNLLRSCHPIIRFISLNVKVKDNKSEHQLESTNDIH